MTRTTRAEREALGLDIDVRTAKVHAELDDLLANPVEPGARAVRLDALAETITALTADIDHLQRITREDRSWG